jgi:hypothetical protein
MTERVCRSCRFYEPSGVWRQGWCRNPTLYGPHESHPVDAGTADCVAAAGRNLWQAADSGETQPRREEHLPPRLQLAAAGPGAVAIPAGGAPMSAGPSRPGSSEERTVSYQPEERYWTDYLRIALPVIGLLLLIALLWYWASALIGDGGDQPPPTPELAAVNPINESTPAPPTATAVVIAPTPGPPEPTPTPAPAVSPTPEAPQPTQPPAAAETENPCANLPVYTAGTIVVTSDEVNLRPGPTTDGEPITTLAAGTRAQITGEFAEAGQCDWWPITVVDTGQSGFVREDFLEAAPA